MSMKSEQKVALVTGGSRGLGRAAALRLARDGFFVALTYRSAAGEAYETVAALKEAGGDGLALQADVSSVASIDALFASLDRELEQRFGDRGLDVLVNNAGIIADLTLDKTTEEDFDALFNTNVKGTFFTTQRAAERMRDNGRVITLGTGLTRFVYPNYIAYAASKGAITTMTEYLAKELGPRGITANVVAPGAIDTDMNPWLRTEQGAAAMSSVAALNRVGHAEDIADVIGFLASPDSRWVTAQRIEASGGANL
jgi:3-oxoacyl-[acyl-carrier protein] reductase